MRFVDDTHLVRGCIQNRRKAQETLYKKYYPAMYRTAAWYFKNADLVEEAVNTAFLKVFTNIETYNSTLGNLEGWIRTIVVNCCIDSIRREKIFRYSDDFDNINEAIEPDVIGQLFEKDVRKLIDLLPPASRAVFSLIVLQGFTHGEVASSLGIAEGTSRWHLAQARKILIQFIQKY